MTSLNVAGEGISVSQEVMFGSQGKKKNYSVSDPDNNLDLVGENGESA